MDKFNINTDNLLEFALNKLNITKEELREELEEEYKRREIDKQVLEDIEKRSNDFTSYCSNRSCMDCEIRKFKKDNNFVAISTGGCILVYEYLFKRGC